MTAALGAGRSPSAGIRPAVRRGDVVVHQRWMIRSLRADTRCRRFADLPLSLAAGAPFEAAYPAIAWAARVPNLIIAECWHCAIP